MTIKQTFDILKYGPMNPDKVRSIIDQYWEDTRGGEYIDDWVDSPVKNTSDSKSTITHFFYLWVYYDDSIKHTVIAFVPREHDFPSVEWQKSNKIIMAVMVNQNDPEEVYTMFHEHYMELHQEAMFKEYQENYPDGSFEH